MDRLLPDVAYAMRRLVRAPAFTTIALLTLAFGIGANSAIFSVVRSLLLRPLPYGDPEQVVMIWAGTDARETTWLSAPEVRSYGSETGSFTELGAYTSSAANLTGGDEPERVSVAAATPELFTALRVRALHGRLFAPLTAGELAPQDVVLGHELWHRRFGGATSIIGQDILVNGDRKTVVGVLPPSFRLPLDFREERGAELYLPLSLDAPNLAGWGNRSLIAVGRLRPGVEPATATAAMEVIEQRWVRDGRMATRPSPVRSTLRAQDLVVGEIRPALFVLVGAVCAILLIACANVANLILARSDDRQREIALRRALGASRATILRQLLTESALLALIGGALGAALAWGGTRLLVALHPPGVPRLADIGVDAAVLGFTMMLALATGILFGIAPALRLSAPELSHSLKDGGRTGTVGRGQQRLRDALAVTQIAFSIVLLIGATLLVRSFSELRRVDLGFSTRDALTFRVTAPVASYAQQADVIAFYRTLMARLAELPGVTEVGATRLLPLTGTIGDWSITLEGRERRAGDNPNGDWQVITPGYFEAMRLPLVRGRFITPADHETAPPVVVINETMAARYWPGEDAIGKRFHLGTAERPWLTVVGIAGQVRHNGVVEEPRAEMYIAHAQFGVAGGSPSRGMTIVMRTSDDPLALVESVRATVRSIDRNIPVAEIRTLERVAGDSLSRQRFTMQLLSVFAALALGLAAIGIYGVISVLVARRRQEIGIRMALGAAEQAIIRMIVRRGMLLAAIGLAVGLAASTILVRALSGLLYGVTRFDTVSFAAGPLILVAVALLACLIPALRAASVDPLVALREE